MDANGHETLAELRAALREQTWTAWQRTLSFGDELQDRWDKARFLGWGEGTSVYDSAVVMGNVQVGEHCWIGPYTLLDGSGGLSIGSHCDV